MKGIACGLALLGLAGVAAAEGRFDPRRLTWKRLEYRATKFFVTLEAEVEIEAVAAPAAGAALLEPPQCGGLAPGDEGALRLGIDSRLLGRQNRIDLWLLPHSGAALQRSELQRARRLDRNRLRSYRYAADGVHALTRRPAAAAELERPPEEWSERSSSFDSYPLVIEPRLGITEPAALFYLLSVAELSSPGDTLHLPVYSKDRVFAVEVRVTARTRIEADFVRRRGDEERRLAGQVEALELALRSRAVEGGEEAPKLQLLGLEGDIRVHLDPELRVPIELGGDLGFVGRGRIHLERVVLE